MAAASPLDDEIFAIARSVWTTLLGVEPDRAEPDAVPGRPLVVGVIDIVGPRAFTLRMEMPEQVAAPLVAAAGCPDSADSAAEAVTDAAAEIVNMVGGNLKGILAGPSNLSLPAVARGGDLTVESPGSRVRCRFGIRHGDHVTRFTLLEPVPLQS